MTVSCKNFHGKPRKRKTAKMIIFMLCDNEKRRETKFWNPAETKNCEIGKNVLVRPLLIIKQNFLESVTATTCISSNCVMTLQIATVLYIRITLVHVDTLAKFIWKTVLATMFLSLNSVFCNRVNFTQISELTFWSMSRVNFSKVRKLPKKLNLSVWVTFKDYMYLREFPVSWCTLFRRHIAELIPGFQNCLFLIGSHSCNQARKTMRMHIANAPNFIRLKRRVFLFL